MRAASPELKLAADEFVALDALFKNFWEDAVRLGWATGWH